MLLATAATFMAAGAARAAQVGVPADTEWRHYANDLANTRYAPLDQINGSNFNRLEVAWRFKTDNFGPRPEMRYECTPILIKGRLFATAGSRRSVVSLDAATGEILWSHHFDEGERGRYAPRQLAGRGVSYWSDGKEERILYVTPGYHLIALDAATGDRVKGFGVDGVVDLKQNFDQEIDLVTAAVGLHSAPTIANDVVIIGAAFLAGNVPATRYNVKGYVRGFDVRTGERIWIFHTIPKPGEFGYDTWEDGLADKAGNAGVWAQISADETLGLAYLGVELPTGDSSGMYRRGAPGRGPDAGLYSETIVAVDIKTGVRRWHYQLIHHGLWDYDIPCAAILCDIPHNGRMVKALAQPTKQAFLYVLNRETGEPIWPIVERPVRAGDVPGEYYSPTQPFPTKPPAYDTQGVEPDDLIDFTPALRAKALELIKNYVTGPLYTAPTLGRPEATWGTLVAPSLTGGTNFPGGAYDPETHQVFVYSKTNVSVVGMQPGDDPTVTDFSYVHAGIGAALRPHTAMGGGPDFIVQRPPGAPAVAPDRAPKPPPPVRNGFQAGVVSIDGLPLLKPPYGRITALDLAKGDLAWQVAHGETPDAIRNHPALKGLAIPRTGQAGNIGPMATKSLVICGDAGMFTDDQGVRGARLRAYDKMTGEEKGAVFIPAPQSGSPMSYMLDGRQYLVVAIGGGTHVGELVAYTLPQAGARQASGEA